MKMSTQNYTTPDDDQKYGRKRFGRKYGTIPLPPISRRKKKKKKKIIRRLEKIKLKIINSVPSSPTKLA